MSRDARYNENLEAYHSQLVGSQPYSQYSNTPSNAYSGYNPSNAHVGHPQAPWEQNAINPYTFIRETNERQYRPPLPSVTPAPYSQSHHIIPRSHTVAPSQSRSTPRFWDGPPSPISPGTYGTFQGTMPPDDPSKPPKTLACDGCSARFARKHDLNRHRRIHTQEMPYVCMGCDKSYRRTDARKRHWDVEPECAARHIAAEQVDRQYSRR